MYRYRLKIDFGGWYKGYVLPGGAKVRILMTVISHNGSNNQEQTICSEEHYPSSLPELFEPIKEGVKGKTVKVRLSGGEVSAARWLVQCRCAAEVAPENHRRHTELPLPLHC